MGIGRTLFDLGTLGGTVSSATDISDTGHVTGFSHISAGSIDYRAFLVPNGGSMIDLGTLGGSTSSGTTVNNSGEVAGDSVLPGNTANHAFLYKGGVMIDLGTLGGSYSSAYGLSENGRVTGESSTAGDAEFHAFLADESGMIDLGTLGGTYSTGFAINDLDEVIGDSFLAGDVDYHGFIYRNGTIQDLGSLGGGFSSVWAVNNLSQVVGVSSTPAQEMRAFLWDNGAIVDLNTLLPANSGWELSDAFYINDQSQIAGEGLFHGQPASFLLTLQTGAEDTTPPEVECPANQEAAANEEGLARVPDLLANLVAQDDSTAASALVKEQVPAAGTPARCGTHEIVVTVTDEAGNQTACDVRFAVVDVSAPTVHCPEAVSLHVDNDCQAAVPNLSTELELQDNCTPASELAVRQLPAPGTLLGPGKHEVKVFATDRAGNTGSCTVVVNITDGTAPVITSLTVSRQVLQPANRKLIPVTVHVAAEDNCDPSPVCRVLSVESSEPVNGRRDRTDPDWLITGDLTVELRAEVATRRSARVYTINVACMDRSGNTSHKSVQVSVPSPGKHKGEPKRKIRAKKNKKAKKNHAKKG
jgi:probable HAF family extracellular repeat protein